MINQYKAAVFGVVTFMAVGAVADENSLYIKQASGNAVNITQAQGMNDVYSILLADQNGMASVIQTAASEQVRIVQGGTNNSASVTQTGNFDVASVTQTGSNNHIMIHQH